MFLVFNFFMQKINRRKGIILIIDTITKEGIEKSLAKYLSISVSELTNHIILANSKAKEGGICFNSHIFEGEIKNIIFNLNPIEVIDEIYVYHLSRRLNDEFDTNVTYNLKCLLLNKTVISEFLKKHEITFNEVDGHPVMFHKGKIKDLSDEYLRGRLGYDKDYSDYCVNGFALKDQLIKNDYTNILSRCPEFIRILSKYLKNDDICIDYYNNSKYYCYTYKIKMSDIIFDDSDKLSGKEKTNYFIIKIFNRLSEYLRYGCDIDDNDNPIIRLKDDVNVPQDNIFYKEEIK